MDTKSRIMDETFKLLLEYGFDAISISQITKEAEITKGALYYFFENKEDLFDQVVEKYIMNFMKDLLISRSNETSSIKEQVRLFYNTKAVELRMDEIKTDSVDSRRNFYRLLQSGIDKYEKLRVQFETFYRNAIDYQIKVLEEGKKKGVIREDVNSRLLALNNMTWGRGMIHIDDSVNLDEVDEMTEEYFNIIWRSISVKGH